MLKKLHGENELMDDEALSDDIETELSSAAIPIGGGAKKKQLNINRYDLVRNPPPPWSTLLLFVSYHPYLSPSLTTCLYSCCPSPRPRAR